MEKKDHSIHVEFAMTYNLGNFNSVKLGGHIDDVVSDMSEFDEKFDELYNMLRTKIFQKLKELKNGQK